MIWHAREREQDWRDEELSVAAGSVQREWDSPRLWPAIAVGIHDIDVDAHAAASSNPLGRWPVLAAAALIAITLGPASWLGWQWFMLGPRPDSAMTEQRRQRLLTEDALATIERFETQYVQAIDELTRLTAQRLEMPDSPLLVNLRERLELIDAAIAEYHVEIARNRFNAHLRQQLLWIYQEKRRTLEQVQEYAPDAL